MAKFRKKPVVIEAVRFTGFNFDEICDYVGYTPEGKNNPRWVGDASEPYYSGVYIETLEGTMLASSGDYIIKGVQGEFYPCKPNIFNETYEIVED